MAPTDAQRLLDASVLAGSKRYAIRDGRAYCAQQHGDDIWHGYPVGWKEVPPTVWLGWKAQGLLSNSDRSRYWDSHQ